MRPSIKVNRADILGQMPFSHCQNDHESRSYVQLNEHRYFISDIMDYFFGLAMATNHSALRPGWRLILACELIVSQRQIISCVIYHAKQFFFTNVKNVSI